MTIFIPYSITIQEDLRFKLADGGQVQVLPGTLHGRLTMIPRTTLPPGVRSDRGVVRIVNNYADDGDNTYRHLAYVLPTVFLPLTDTVCRRCPAGAFMGTTVETRPHTDPRGLIKAMLDDGSVFEPLPDHDRFMVVGGDLDAHANLYVKLTTFNSRTAKGSFASGGAAIEYRIPIQELLWRKAARITDTDLIPEAEDHIIFECTGTSQMSDYPIPPSPIRIIPPPTIDTAT